MIFEPQRHPTGWQALRAGICLGLLGLMMAGCGPPQVEAEHRELILLLATASSTRNPELLESTAKEIEELRAEGGLSRPEASAFDAILDAGRSGDWERARRRAYALRDAQRPTEADVERIKSRPLPPPRTFESGERG